MEEERGESSQPLGVPWTQRQSRRTLSPRSQLFAWSHQWPPYKNRHRIFAITVQCVCVCGKVSPSSPSPPHHHPAEIHAIGIQALQQISQQSPPINTGSKLFSLSLLPLLCLPGWLLSIYHATAATPPSLPLWKGGSVSSFHVYRRQAISFGMLPFPVPNESKRSSMITSHYV